MARELAVSRGSNEHENSEAVENRGTASTKGTWRSFSSLMLQAVLVLPLVILLLPSRAGAQILDIDNAEFGGGYTHVTGDGGLNGGNLTSALTFNRIVSLAFNYDTVWNNNTLGAFALTSIGLARVRTHQQNFLVGPRIYFPGKKLTKYHFDPFAEAQIGFTHENQQLSTVATGTLSASANSYSWLIGGGADYSISKHWVGRLNADFFRTHIASTGQSRFRLGLGVAYAFGSHATK